MDELIAEFLTETTESLDLIDNELVRFEQDSNNAKILGNVFRLVHTIKGTCGFLGLARLEALAHAAETLMGRYRDGAVVTQEGVSTILLSIDRIKSIIAGLEASGTEPEGSDRDLIERLEAIADEKAAAPEPKLPQPTSAVDQKVLDELEAAWQAAEGPEEPAAAAPQAGPNAAAPPQARREAAPRKGPEEGADEGARDGAAKSQSIRVSVETLERLMTQVSELVLTRNQLLEIARRHKESEFKAPLARLSNVTAELQEGVMKTRMQPIGNAWQKLPRIIRDLSKELGKEIELTLHGEDTELDRQVLELIKDPLTHMVRNAADHGLESPADRRTAGKSETGTVRLEAYHQGGHIIISISDDGRGLNPDRIRRKALDNGLASEAELDKMSEAQLFRFIFHPGFSTASSVTSVSGRGVGMDVVRTNIELIGGSIDLKSVLGRGSTFTIKIPLTLAIVSALIVDVTGERFAIPQINVLELVRTQTGSEHRIEKLKDAQVLRLRDKLLPLVHLGRLLGLSAAQPAEEANGFIVVMQVGSRVFGVLVDGVFQTEEIVVKPMASMLADIGAFSGNTILGDGNVILILDPNGLVGALGAEAADDEALAAEAAAVEAAAERRTLLVFRAGSADPKAVPLSLITRLEEIEASAIERSAGRHLVQYRGQLMPVFPVDGSAIAESSARQPVLVIAEGEHPVGLAVDAILDIVEEVLELEIVSDKPGRLGSAVIRGKATELVDVGYYVQLALGAEVRPSRAKASRRRVLLVDDSAFFRDLLAPTLEAAGYDVTVAAGADEALALLGERGCEILISDVDMPGRDGFQLAEAVRADARHEALPFIALASHTSAAQLDRGRKLGFHDFVGKFDRQGLVEALREIEHGYGAAA